MTDIMESTRPASGNAKSKEPKGGGDPTQHAREWGGGSKGSKGDITARDRANEQSSSRS